jgi:hypothetical protein
MRGHIGLCGMFLFACSEAPRMQPLPPQPDGVDMASPPAADLAGQQSPSIDLAAPALSLGAISPRMAATVGRDRITLTGTGFDNKVEVSFAGVRADIESVTPTQIVAYAPANPGNWGTPIVVAVRRTTDGARVTNSDAAGSPTAFRYYASAIDFRQRDITFTQYGRPRIAIFADLNNDGKKDMAMMQQDYGNYTSYLNNGTGAFQYYSNYGTACGIATFDGVSGDLDKDNNVDIVFTNSGSTVSYHLGNGTGSINSRANNCYGVGSGSQSVTLLDVNGDTYLDIVIAASGSAYLGVLPNRLPNNGNNIGNVFDQGQAFTLNPQGSAIRAIAVDINNDNKMDLVGINNGDGQSTLFWFDSSKVGTNGATPSGFSGSNNNVNRPYGLECADFNGDGFVDCAVSDVNSRTVRIFLNNGAGGFNAPAAAMPIPSDAYTLRLEDVNLDGKVDLVVPTREASAVSVFPGRGDGTFGTITAPDGRVLASRIDYAIGCRYAWSVRFEDLDGDGRKELAVVCEANDRGEVGYGQVRTFRNISQ